MSARQRQVQQDRQTANQERSPATRSSNTASNGQSQTEQSSGMWGWLESTGDWIADKYDAVTTGVGEWAGGVRDSANEIWDVVESSSFEAKDGIWSLNTDLDEIQDVAGLQGLSLDREASDNEVRMEIDRNTGVLTLKCANLAINALAFEGFTAQSVSLSDVHIRVENASMEAGFLGTLSAKKGGATNAPQNVSLRAGSIVGRGIQVQDASINNGEAIHVDQIQLDNFELQANGSKELFEEAPNQASFSVANAVLQGIRTKQGESDIGGNISMSEASASFDAASNSGSLNIADVQASQIVAGDNHIENSQFQGVQANIAPTADGNGHIATMSADRAAMRNIDTSTVDSTSIASTGLAGSFNTQTQHLSASANSLRANDVTGMGGTANSIQANNILASTDLDDNVHSGSIGTLSGTGLSTAEGSVEQATLNNLVAASSDSGQTASLKGATVSGLSGYGHTADLLTIGGATASNVGNSQNLKMDSANLRGYQSEYGTVERAGLRNVDLRSNDGRASGSVESASMSNANLMGTTVGDVSARNANFAHSAEGSHVSLGNGTVSNISGFGTQADRISIDNLSAHGNTDLSQSGFSVGQVSGQNLSHEAGQIGNLSVNDIRGSRNQDTYNASVASMSANNATAHGFASVGNITGTNASVQATLGKDTEYSADLESLSVSDATEHTFGATIGKADFKGAKVSGTNTHELHTALDSGSVQNFAMQGGSIESAAVAGFESNINRGRGDVKLDEVAFSNAQYEDMLRVGNGVAQNIRAQGTAESQTGSMDAAHVGNISVIQPQSVSHIGSASLSGGHFAHNGEGKGSIGVNNVGAKDIQVDISDMSKGESVSGATTDPVANVDFNEMLATGARRLNNAQIQAQVGMKPGQLGSGLASVGIEEGTTLDANINIANNQIQDGSSITANKALDTALFTSVKGGYVEDGELKADVRGWFDMGISENINDTVGLDGNRLHSLGDYAQAVSNMPESSSENTMENPVDFTTLRAQGNASLSDGTISAGDANLTLDGASKGSNQMEFEATHQQIAMKFAQLLASSFQLNTALGQGQTGEVAVDNGSFTVNPQKGTARGLVDSVSVSDINIQN